VVVGFLFVTLRVGVACHSEEIARSDCETWEEHVQGVRHHFFEPQKVMWLTGDVK
jgi:hypothetical protein